MQFLTFSYDSYVFFIYIYKTIIKKVENMRVVDLLKLNRKNGVKVQWKFLKRIYDFEVFFIYIK